MKLLQQLIAVSIMVTCLVGCSVLPSKPQIVEPTPVATVQRTLYVFGDSLSAWYRLAIEESYPMLVEQLLRDRGYEIRVINAGESWDTSAWLLERLSWVVADALSGDIALVVIGGNDGLQWLPVPQLEDNLTTIVTDLQSHGLTTIIGGMQLPTNFWPQYRSDFAAVYPRVASGAKSLLIPFILTGVGGIPELNLSDGIHPNTTWQQIIAQTVVDFLVTNNLFQ